MQASGEHFDDLLSTMAAHLIERRKPHLLLVHLVDLDHEQHLHGPESPEALRTLEHIDAAIGSLNTQGYLQGFTSVTLMRSTNPQLPDAYVYAFNCPLDRTVVGISASSGQVLWKEFY